MKTSTAKKTTGFKTFRTTDHLLGDRVSVRCRRSHLPGDKEASWLPGIVIASEPTTTRYVVQLDDNRRVVAFGDDVRRWTLAFDFLESLEKLAS